MWNKWTSVPCLPLEKWDIGWGGTGKEESLWNVNKNLENKNLKKIKIIKKMGARKLVASGHAKEYQKYHQEAAIWKALFM